jgi:hypothetical protein
MAVLYSGEIAAVCARADKRNDSVLVSQLLDGYWWRRARRSLWIEENDFDILVHCEMSDAPFLDYG